MNKKYSTLDKIARGTKFGITYNNNKLTTIEVKNKEELFALLIAGAFAFVVGSVVYNEMLK